MSLSKIIYCGFGAAALDAKARAALDQGTRGWELMFAPGDGWSNLTSVEPDVRMQQAEVVFGQPDPTLLSAARARWVHLTSAGYARYDEDAVRHDLQTRQTVLTTSSSVYAEPCAEHVLAMMLAMARRLPDLVRDQAQQTWRDVERRQQSSVLRGQSLVLLGYGAIARRLTELLVPFHMDVVAIRRRARGDEPIAVLTLDALPNMLSRADHVVSTLPDSASTRGFMHGQRFAQMKPGAHFYNVGRGTTVDHAALADALRSGTLGAACLDVTDPEPLPAGHALWSTPGCYITPHTAGGRATERLELVRHFVQNLQRYTAGEALLDRVLG